MGIDMSELETLAYMFLKSLYVFGIVCGLTPPLLLTAVLLNEWRRVKKRRARNADAVVMSNALRVPAGASVPHMKRG